MKRALLVVLALILTFSVSVVVSVQLRTPQQLFFPVAKNEHKAKPLEKYSFEELRKRKFAPSEIEFAELIKEHPDSSSWMFYFESDGKRISGEANLPAGVATTSGFVKPVIVLVRGFIDKEKYFTGAGTQRVAHKLAKNGYVTLAPDFVGFGKSARASGDDFQNRFESYTSVLNLIASVEADCSQRSTDHSLQQSIKSSSQNAVDCKLGLWGHSNGGQIALSVLAISGKKIPTVLWNPVSKPFPYSILYYTDEFEDKGKALRKALAQFEEDYDVEKYNVVNYLGWIEAQISLQQGGADEEVPQKWSDELYEALREKGKDITYKVSPGADHNMLSSWETAVGEALIFFDKHL